MIPLIPSGETLQEGLSVSVFNVVAIILGYLIATKTIKQ